MGDMDSGNSGSVQSSSTGTGDNDQEYESRRHDHSISAFFNPTTYPSGSFAGFENPQSLQLYSLRFNPGSNSSSPGVFGQHQQVHNSCYGSLEIGPNNFPPISNSNSNGNNNGLDMVWPNKFGPLRSQSEDAHLHSDLGSSRHNNNHHHHHHQDLGTAGGAQPPQQLSPGGGPPRASGRNPKKRSRASRRAPTTVMTTDTSNFRQMVQEFTGIPAPPFSASGFPTRTRLDLFGFSGLGMSSIPRAGSGSSPPYRPFPQKMLSNPLPVVPQAGSSSSTSAGATNIISSTSTSASGSTTNNISNFQNYFTFQSLLQPSSTIMDHPGSVHGTSTTTTTTTTVGPRNGGGGLGSRCETTTDQTSWAAALNQGLGLGRQGDHTRCSVNDGGGNYGGVINVTSSENNGGALRAEGMLESWICSSDN